MAQYGPERAWINYIVNAQWIKPNLKKELLDSSRRYLEDLGLSLADAAGLASDLVVDVAVAGFAESLDVPLEVESELVLA